MKRGCKCSFFSDCGADSFEGSFFSSTTPQVRLLEVEQMRWSTLTPAVRSAETLAGGVRVTHSLPLCLCALFQDRSAVLVLGQPEPELAGEEHSPPGQQQHAGPAHLCQ